METATTTSMPLSPNTYESASNQMAYPTGTGTYHPPAVRAPSRRRIGLWTSIAGFLLALLILAAIGVIALYAYIAWVLARPTVAPLTSNPMDAASLPYEDVTFSSEAAGHLLEGWYIPAGSSEATTGHATDGALFSKKTIIFSHGYGGNREEIWVPIYQLAQVAHEQGYNALMFDYGYVYNADRVVTGGAKESRDLLGAVEYARSRGAEEVVVWGFSMGAGTALQAALQTDRIDAMILDSTFVLEPDTLYHNLKQYAAELPREPSLTLLRWLYPLVNDSGLGDVPYQQIKSTVYDIPVFMIHGMLDERSPYNIIRGIALNQTKHEASDYWLVPNATHELVYRAKKEEYITRVTAFLAAATKQ
ncbi:alpha/beta hydrolase [Paenibacillus sp. TRM 82003]|nr:alpha/beta hydrolase [Paenibacillus sp. TRM 82003]